MPLLLPNWIGMGPGVESFGFLFLANGGRMCIVDSFSKLVQNSFVRPRSSGGKCSIAAFTVSEIGGLDQAAFCPTIEWLVAGMSWVFGEPISSGRLPCISGCAALQSSITAVSAAAR